MNYGIRYVGADDSDSLEHYGVLGMKRGVHRGRTAHSEGIAVGKKYADMLKNHKL